MQPCLGIGVDIGFIIADDQGFWQELRRLPGYTLEFFAPGIPALTIRHQHPRFSLRPVSVHIRTILLDIAAGAIRIPINASVWQDPQVLAGLDHGLSVPD